MNFIRLGKTQKHVIRESTTNIDYAIVSLGSFEYSNTNFKGIVMQ